MNVKAIILAGGSGTRLYPVSQVVNKHFLPIYNKPMIYYPLSLAMLLKIKDIYMIVNPQDKDMFQRLLGDGSKLGISITYVEQKSPNGLAEGLILCENILKNSNVFYLLGDNILYGHSLIDILEQAKQEVLDKGGAYVFGYYVNDPHRFGIVELDDNNNVISIEEKPKYPKSNFAIIGAYFFDKKVFDIVKTIKPSHREELEITSVLERYLEERKLKVKLLGRGFAWFDAGTQDSFLEAGNFVATIEKKTGLMIGCIEEIAYKNHWITKSELLHIAKPLSKTDYGKYLIQVAKE